MSKAQLPFTVTQSVNDKAAEIRLAIFDVDGVLTDGHLYYGENGETLKVFHAHDGLGIKQLMLAGIEVAIISARDSQALRHRLDDLGVHHRYLGVHDKGAAFNELCESVAISFQHCSYMGDDIIDLPILSRCGFATAVANAHHAIIDKVDWVAPFNGGQGAVRSLCELILSCQGKLPDSTVSSQ